MSRKQLPPDRRFPRSAPAFLPVHYSTIALPRQKTYQDRSNYTPFHHYICYGYYRACSFKIKFSKISLGKNTNIFSINTRYNCTNYIVLLDWVIIFGAATSRQDRKSTDSDNLHLSSSFQDYYLLV